MINERGYNVTNRENFSENINLFEATIMEQPLSMQEVGGDSREEYLWAL